MQVLQIKDLDRKIARIMARERQFSTTYKQCAGKTSCFGIYPSVPTPSKFV